MGELQEVAEQYSKVEWKGLRADAARVANSSPVTASAEEASVGVRKTAKEEDSNTLTLRKRENMLGRHKSPSVGRKAAEGEDPMEKQLFANNESMELLPGVSMEVEEDQDILINSKSDVSIKVATGSPSKRHRNLGEPDLRIADSQQEEEKDDLQDSDDDLSLGEEEDQIKHSVDSVEQEVDGDKDVKDSRHVLLIDESEGENDSSNSHAEAAILQSPGTKTRGNLAVKEQLVEKTSRIVNTITPRRNRSGTIGGNSPDLKLDDRKEDSITLPTKASSLL